MSATLVAWLSRLSFVALVVVPACTPKTKAGDPARDFSAPDLNGRNVRLQNLRGKVVLLNFWGTWCGPCRQEFPELVRLHQRLKDRGFEIVAVDVGDDDEEAVKAFADGAGATFSIVRDQGASSLYGVASFPTNVLIDRSGVIRFQLRGYGSDSVARLGREAEKLLPAPAR